MFSHSERKIVRTPHEEFMRRTPGSFEQKAEARNDPETGFSTEGSDQKSGTGRRGAAGITDPGG